MEIYVGSDYEKMCLKAAEDIAQYIRKKPDALLCLAAGDTPTGIYRELVRMKKEEGLNVSQCRFIGLDEWAGLSRQDDGSCMKYIYEQVFEPLEIKNDHIFFFDATAEDLQEECRKADIYLQEHPVDIALMGVGMNGHIGLNEPGTPFEIQAHISCLTETTKHTAQKYFEREKVLEKGITLGLGQIQQSELLMIVASGEKKAEVVRAALQESVTKEMPASFLRLHKNCMVYLDTEAASKLKGR